MAFFKKKNQYDDYLIFTMVRRNVLLSLPLQSKSNNITNTILQKAHVKQKCWRGFGWETIHVSFLLQCVGVCVCGSLVFKRII